MFSPYEWFMGGLFLLGLFLIISFIRSPLKTIFFGVLIIVGINVVMAVIAGVASVLTKFFEFIF